MKLSIVIPVYHVEATLDRCMESVVSQDFDDFEVVLVDDGSTDRCPLMCDEWARRDRRISVIHKQNGGLSDARNAGIEQARGQYITFIDSDDYISPGTLKAVMDRMDGNDILEYPLCRFCDTKEQSLLTFGEKVYTNADDYWLTTKAYQHTYACNKIYRRSLFDDVRYPVGRVFEDAYTLPLLLRRASVIATTGEGCYYYCLNSQGITATAQGQELRQLLEAHLEGAMPMDDEYYMRLLNIQMDVCRLTGEKPRLPSRHITAVSGFKNRLKSIALNKLGINALCNINKVIHRICRW